MPPGQLPAYGTTDSQALVQMQDRTLEPRSVGGGGQPTFSGMWSTQEMVDFLDYRQKLFLKLTGVTVVRSGYDGAGADHSITVPANQTTFNEPQNLIDILRMAFVNYDTSDPVVANAIQEVPREDVMLLDGLDQTWDTDQQPTPSDYTDSVTQPLTAQFNKAPSDIGAVDLTYVAFSEALTGLGVPLSVPDECAPAIVWGALADAFAKEGEAQDLARSEYCEARFQLFVELTKMLIRSPSLIQAGM